MFVLEDFLNYEKYFYKSHTLSHEIISGSKKVMLSAPHSVTQIRNGKEKLSEPQTGALLKYLNKVTNCPVIYKTKNCNDDANFDAVSPYKKDLETFIKNNNVNLLLDLHQLSQKRSEEINIGTDNFKNVNDKDLLNKIISVFEKNNLKVSIDMPFSATRPNTVSKYVFTTCNITALQIEINNNLVWSNNVSELTRVKDVFNSLKEIILLNN